MPQQKNQVVLPKKGVKKIAPKYAAQQTLQYKTFVKRMVTEALQNGFSFYTDVTLAKTKIGPKYSTASADFPFIVVKFYEQTIRNAGVGHMEWGEAEESLPRKYIEYHHRIYKGDIALEVYGLSTVDRDKVTDAVVEVVAMGEVGVGGKDFKQRIYDSIGTSPYSKWHFFNVNTDLLSGYGEQEMIAPWIPEDTMVYKCEYRVPVLGEFYSITPKQPAGGTGLVEEVDIYPWDPKDPEDTPPEDFPNEKVPDEDYIKITAEPEGKVEL